MAAESLKLRSGRLEWRELEGEIVALDVGSSNYIAIQGSGVALWPLLVEGADRDRLVRELVERFGVSEEDAGRDVDAFLDDMRAQDLLEEGSG